MLRWVENRTLDRGHFEGGASCRFSTLSACVEAEFDGHETRLCYTSSGLFCPCVCDWAEGSPLRRRPLGKGRVSGSQSVRNPRVRTGTAVCPLPVRDPDEKLTIAVDRVGWAGDSHRRFRSS
jgi:hypothetical protein